MNTLTTPPASQDQVIVGKPRPSEPLLAKKVGSTPISDILSPEDSETESNDRFSDQEDTTV
jgi:hypothetical protein